MNCGDVVDPLILENRSHQQDLEPAHRVRPFGGNVMWVPSRHIVSVDQPVPCSGSGRGGSKGDGRR